MGRRSTRDRARPDHYPAGLSFPTTNSSINCELPRTTGALETHNISPRARQTISALPVAKFRRACAPAASKSFLFVCAWLIFQG